LRPIFYVGGNAGNPPTRRKSIRKPKVQKGKVHVIDGKKKIKSSKLPERINTAVNSKLSLGKILAAFKLIKLFHCSFPSLGDF